MKNTTLLVLTLGLILTFTSSYALFGSGSHWITDGLKKHHHHHPF